MVIYHYDRSGVYLWAGEAKPSPASGTHPDGTPKAWLIPARATDIKPPQTAVGEVAVFDETGRSWTAEEDHRGRTIWNTSTLIPKMLAELGPVPDGYTLLQPQDQLQKWDGEKWVVDMVKATEAARQERDAKLFASDWTQLPDSPLDDATKALWATYRQALRDYLTDWAPGKPWPEAPA